MGLATTCGHDQGDAILYSALQKEFRIMNCKSPHVGILLRVVRVKAVSISTSIDDLC